MLLLALVAGFCGGGCMTGNLWHDKEYIVPAPDPKLSLSQTPRGILVQYDAMLERTGKIHRRRYLLEPNIKRLAKGDAPIPFKPLKGESERAIRIFRTVPSDRDYCAVVATNLTTFTIHRRGLVLGPYDLPVYKDREWAAAQWALTPLAVAADASVVGAVVYGAIKSDANLFPNGIFPLDYSGHADYTDPPGPPP